MHKILPIAFTHTHTHTHVHITSTSRQFCPQGSDSRAYLPHLISLSLTHTHACTHTSTSRRSCPQASDSRACLVCLLSLPQVRTHHPSSSLTTALQHLQHRIHRHAFLSVVLPATKKFYIQSTCMPFHATKTASSNPQARIDTCNNNCNSESTGTHLHLQQ